MRILLKNAKIYDGAANAPFTGDILVEDERIAAVAPSIEEKANKVIDLGGLSVSSGFFDAHSHNDWFCIKKEPLKYFEPFIRQGITSFITGNCGLSAVGFEKDTPYLDKIGGGLFHYDSTTKDVYPSVKSFLEGIDGKNPCNIAVLVGHCTARTGVAGWESRELNPQEKERMLGIMEQGLKEGACGLSLGMMYEPARALSAITMDYPMFGRAHNLRALDELVEISKGTHLKLQYSHAIFVGTSTFKTKDELHSILDNLRKEGVDAWFDIYHETLGVSVMTVFLPSWFQELSPEERRKPKNRIRLATVCNNLILKMLGFGWKDIQIAYLGPGLEQYEGKTIAQIAREWGKSCFYTYLELAEMSGFKGRANMGPYSTPEIIEWQSKMDNVLYMTDAWVEENGIQNPAIYDCFPKFIHFSLLGKGDTMPNTIRKMTGAVADRFSIPDRGYVRPGYFADLTVFDEAEMAAATPDQERSFGIKRVFINGKEVLSDGVLDTESLKTSGHALRN